MKLLYRVGADLIFVFHFAFVGVGLFGWLIPSLWYLYMAVLVLTLLSYLWFRRCIFTTWEFALRKRANPDLSFNSDWIPYYAYKLTHQHISDWFILRAGMFFLTASLGLSLYFRYLY